METCKKMIVAGAKAGIKQKGNSPNISTPCAPVSMDSLVRKNAVAEVAIISRKPKVFQTRPMVFQFEAFCWTTLATQILLRAVMRSPKPARKPILPGRVP